MGSCHVLFISVEDDSYDVGLMLVSYGHVGMCSLFRLNDHMYEVAIVLRPTANRRLCSSNTRCVSIRGCGSSGVRNEQGILKVMVRRAPVRGL